MASKGEIYDWVKDVLKGEFQLADGQLTPAAHLVDDLDLDSIDAIDMAIRLEEKTGLSFEEDDLKSIHTIQDAINFIDERLQGA